MDKKNTGLNTMEKIFLTIIVVLVIIIIGHKIKYAPVNDNPYFSYGYGDTLEDAWEDAQRRANDQRDEATQP